MLQSSGKVTRKKVRPGSKVSNKKSGSHQTIENIHTIAATPQANSSTGVSPADKSGDSPVTLPAKVEQIFEVQPVRLEHHLHMLLFICAIYNI